VAHAERAGSKGTATANYYEILGVEQWASHDVIKRGFLDLALRFQREAAEARSREALERVAFRQHEIEEAWSTLRNPAARARYDDELRAAHDARAQAALGARPTELAPTDDVEVLDVLASDDEGHGRPRPSEPRSKRRRIFGSSFRSPPAPPL
jgi:DnaJ-class molecular chaperone